MSNYTWLTPEEMQRKKSRQKKLLYVTLLIGTVLLSAALTVLANQI